MENLSQQLLQIIIDNIPQLISAGSLFAGFYMAGIIAKKVISSRSLTKHLLKINHHAKDSSDRISNYNIPFLLLSEVVRL